MSKGCFIVIDGIDGTGKKTQLDLLKIRLESEGLAVETADFPQYGNKSAGPVEDYLNGKFGAADEVGAYRSSIFFAVDRYAASKKITGWQEAGKVVITNRYVSANMGHQGGKISDTGERAKYFAWLDELEYSLFKIPRPNVNIILHIPPEIAQQLVDKKAAEVRTYSENKRDIHEADINHLRNAEQTYLEISRTFPGFILIECYESGRLLSREEVHEKVWQTVQKFLPAKTS